MNDMRESFLSRGWMLRLAVVSAFTVPIPLLAVSLSKAQRTAATAQPCTPDNGGITLPQGFCATIFADNVGHARQVAVAPNGVLYVNTWSGRYYRNDTPPAGGFLVALQDTSGSGHADRIVRFGPGPESGNAGGTGIALHNGALYAETNDRIVRYLLPAGNIAPSGAPDVIVSELPLTGDHPMHPFRIDADGSLYVDLGSATNACQVENRIPQSKGIEPCTAGLTEYDVLDNRCRSEFFHQWLRAHGGRAQ
jgi:glucose/arabinose dehydrogenase